MKGILAKKIGMSRLLEDETGVFVPVTVLEVSPAKVIQVKTLENDGYAAAVLGGFERKNFGKNENKKYKFIKEVSIEEGEIASGDIVDASAMGEVERVKVTGISKGRGFAGVIKRHNFSRGPETHGSHHHREPGSVGTSAKPGRIQKGKKLPGHYGAEQTSLRNVKVIKIDAEKNLIALKGGVPGSIGGYVFITEQQ